MPKTTQVASSCAIVEAPARFISSRPSAPSSPMPVISTPTAFGPAAWATDRNSTSTLGRWRATSGPSVTRMAYWAPFRTTRVCLLPGAISTQPGRTRSPSSPSFTYTWQCWFRRSANAAVNASGMCWTTTNPGASRGSPVRSVAQRLGAARGGADGDDLVGRDREQARRWAAAPRRRCFAWWAASAGPRPHPGACARRAPHLVHEQDGGLIEEVLDAGRGLLHDVHGAVLQRAQHGVRAAAGQRRAHEDGNRIGGHDLLEKREPVHVRHLQIQDDHVGPMAIHLGPRDQRVRGHVHREPGLARQHAGHHLAHDRGVVHHQHVHVIGRPRRGHRGRCHQPAVPATAAMAPARVYTLGPTLTS